MVKVNDFLTDEQIEMLLNDLDSNGLLVLFFMDYREKIDILSARRNVWSSKCNYFNKFFDDLVSKQPLYDGASIDEVRSYSEELHSLLLSIQHCADLVSIYDILLENIK